MAIVDSRLGVSAKGSDSVQDGRQFQYGWTNNLDDIEARHLYDTYHVPVPGAPLFQAALANLNLFGGETKLDLKYPDRGPLL